MKSNQYRYLLLFFSQWAHAVVATSTNSNSDWKGFYFGTKAGAVFSHFDTPTLTAPGPLLDPTQTNIVNIAGEQKLNTGGFLSGIEGGYNGQFKQFIFGLDASFQSLSLSDLINSGAVADPNNANHQFVLTSYANNNWLFMTKPKLGVHKSNWMLYVTGGLGLTLLQSDFIFSDDVGSLESQRASQWKAGYVVGAGIETDLTEHLRLKTEYLYGRFNDVNAQIMNNHNTPAGQTFSNQVSLDENILTLGINYHFSHKKNTIELLEAGSWEPEIGTRLFFSSGIDGAPQPLLNSSTTGNILASRLTFSKLSAVSQEVFARIDHKSGVFAKGYLGAGSVTNGQLNDEDFPAINAYSNTKSNAEGNLSYATIDFGYSFALSTTKCNSGYKLSYS